MRNAFAEENNSPADMGSVTPTPSDTALPTEASDAEAAEAQQQASPTPGADEAAAQQEQAAVDAQQNFPTSGASIQLNVNDAETSPTPTTTVGVDPTTAPIPQRKGGGIMPWVFVLLALLVVAVAIGMLLRKRKRETHRRRASYSVSNITPEDSGPRVSIPGSTQPSGAGQRMPISPAGRARKPMPQMPPSGKTVPKTVVDAGPTESKVPYSVGYAQIVGKRENQEDSFCFSRLDAEYISQHGLLAAVADGIGGLNNGEIASNTVLRNMCENFNRQDASLSLSERLLELAGSGQKDVLKLNHEGYQCGTTLVSVMIQNGEFAMLSVGDSRIALYRGGILLQLNREHVLGKENDEDAALNQAFPVTEPRRRKAITAYLGKENLRTVDRTLRPTRLLPGDRLLLMSDGVFGTLSDDELISAMHLSPDAAAKAIVKAVEAKNAPYQDNATIVIVGYD